MIQRIVSTALCAALFGCGGSTEDLPGSAAPAAAPSVSAPASAPAGSASPASSVPQLARTASPEGASVYLLSPADGEIVQSPFRVVFGLRGFGVAPAGIARSDAGHHHLLIDTEVPPLDAPIPADERHRHFGLGQTETELTLPPGEHRLQLLLGDHLHVPHDPPLLSDPVVVRVAE